MAHGGERLSFSLPALTTPPTPPFREVSFIYLGVSAAPRVEIGWASADIRSAFYNHATYVVCRELPTVPPTGFTVTPLSRAGLEGSMVNLNRIS